MSSLLARITSKNTHTSEVELVFVVIMYEILIYLTSEKTMRFKYLRCQAYQENNYPSKTCPLILTVLVIVSLN